MTCTHLEPGERRAQFLGQHFAGALAVINVKVSSLKSATTIPSTLNSLFGQSGHPWLLSPEQIATMPPSSDWVFSAGELVTVVNPVSTEAIVDVARDGVCEVSASLLQGTEVARTVVLVPNTYLRKKISVGNTVEIVARGKTLRRAVTTGLKNNNISTVKWDHIPVVGLRGSVTELDDDANVACVVFGCFEAVLQIHVKSIQSIASGSSTREQWVDYDFIRRANTHKFLHDSSPVTEIPSK
ncbi:hypothetical protein GGU11DRAFT_749148 [Lentinula aff. detonsa]|nr:hypothetical protein GGU11DRAFT_749148 [Lentinula aff. detonsa]